MMNVKNWMKKIFCTSLFVLVTVFGCGLYSAAVAHAEETPTPAPTETPAADPTPVPSETAKPVEVREIDYEADYIRIQVNHNENVYFSDSKKKTWTRIDGVTDTEDCLTLDMSSISEKKAYELNLKGSEDSTVVAVNLPKYNGTFKAKYNAAENILTFSEEDGATEFQWRKSSATGAWTTVKIDMLKGGDDVLGFQKEMDKLTAKGGKISVRLPQKKGTSLENLGTRMSRTVTVAIPKRRTAPSISVNPNTLKLNTRATMEYCLDPVGNANSDTANVWKPCERNMLLTDINASLKDAFTLAIRTAETEKLSYSKYTCLEIPAQRGAPDPGKVKVTVVSEKKSTVSFTDASSASPYQYAVVKKGNEFKPSTAAWKKVTSDKAISFSAGTYPAGSKIYVRLIGAKKTKTTDFVLPSAYAEITLTYDAAGSGGTSGSAVEATSAPTPTPAP